MKVLSKIGVLILKTILTKKPTTDSNECDDVESTQSILLTMVENFVSLKNRVPLECDFSKSLATDILIINSEKSILEANEYEKNCNVIECITIKNSFITTIEEGFFKKFLRLKKVILDGNLMLEFLPQSFYDLKTLKELKIDNDLLTTIPKNFSTLVSLDLSNNKSLSISDINGFYKLTALKTLILSNNKLHQLSDKILEIPKLENLILSDNLFFELPPVINKIATLKKLDLSKNYFEQLSKEFNPLFEKLETLDLSNNYLTGLQNINTKDFLECKHTSQYKTIANLFKTHFKNSIKNLNISQNKFNKVDALYNLKCFVNLTTLTISDNNLKVIPDSIYTLKKLKCLDISSNQIQFVSDQIKKLINLYALNISKNSFLEIPSSLYKSKHLEILDISYNQLQNLSNIKIASLKQLFATNNNLNTLIGIENFPQLQKLDVSHNFITSIPFSFYKLIHLTEFIVSNNNISYFPEFLFEMKYLKTCKANDNKSEFDESKLRKSSF